GSVTPWDAKLTIFLATVSASGSEPPTFRIMHAFSNAAILRAIVSGSTDDPAMNFLIGNRRPLIQSKGYGVTFDRSTRQNPVICRASVNNAHSNSNLQTGFPCDQTGPTSNITAMRQAQLLCVLTAVLTHAFHRKTFWVCA